MTQLTVQDPDHTSKSEDGSELHLTHLDPIPSYEESISAPRPGSLQILGATFGGVTCTPQIQKLVDTEGGGERLTLDLRRLNVALRPDPAPGVVKVLTVLYRFDDDADLDTRLFYATEDANPSKVIISRQTAAAAQAQAKRQSTSQRGGGASSDKLFHGLLERPWRAGPGGEVDILAVVYGPRRVEATPVLSVLANHFEGRWGQVRMTNDFFGKDPWPYKRKTWTIYFRFVGSRRVQVVTGWENGALEIPWSRQ